MAEVDPHLFVIFGATGDLARRKLLPAYYELVTTHGFGTSAQLMGVGRRNMTDDEFRDLISQSLVDVGVPSDQANVWCAECVQYCGSQDGFQSVSARISELEQAKDMPGNRVFYLALPPTAFGPAIESLGKAGLGTGPGYTRLVVEKPFGRDLASARDLNRLVHRYFEEPQVYRIDHYLGKETVQNLLVFRFANSLFESSWNRDRVDHVDITVAETIGVEARSAYYDGVGALRDMIQNHLTQIMTLVAMEPPATWHPDAIRNEKVKVLRSIEEVLPGEVAFGQYEAGKVDGEMVTAYREEHGVPPDSSTETAVIARINVDNWRWQGVPFFLRTGKRFPKTLTRIVVTFRQPPVFLFERGGVARMHSNRLVITLQPNEGFELLFDVKAPEAPLHLETLPLSFSYGDAFGHLPDAYETLLLDVLNGDQTLFVRSDEVEESWRLYDPLLAGGPKLFPYEAGTWGPVEAYDLVGKPQPHWLVD
ncbi:MAG: glucose-6-phosphate dehydrogenase [Acidimicrobiia bacterium]